MTSTNWVFIALILLGVLYAAIFAITLRRKPREPASSLLLLHLVISMLWALTLFASELDWLNLAPEGLTERLQLYTLFLLALVFSQLDGQFLQVIGRGYLWWAAGAVWLLMLVVLGENVLGLQAELGSLDGQELTPQTISFGALILGWGLLMGLSTFRLARVFRGIRRPLHRNRLRYWALALGFSIVGGALFLLQQYVFGLGFHQLGVIIAAYVILVYRQPDLRWVARMFFSYLLATLLTMLMYLGGMVAAEAFLHNIPNYSSVVSGAVLALLVAALFSSLLKGISRLINRLAASVNYDPSKTVSEYSASISNILDLKYLTTVAVGLISEALEIQRGALFVVHHEFGDDRDSSGYFYLRPMRGMGKKLSPGLISGDSPVANYLQQERQPLTQYEIDLLPRFSTTPATECEWLTSLDADVFVPIRSQEQWIGLLVLGPKISGDRYFDDDLAMLRTLADQTAVALENARLFEDLKARNKENERLNTQLSAANRELEQLGEAKSDFIDIASHELRTPLTQVRGYNDILGEMITDGSLNVHPATGIKITENIRRASRRLEEIVKTMLDVSQIDTSTLSLSLTPTSSIYFIKGAAAAWEQALIERKQSLSIEGIDGLPTLMADSQRLQQAFSCLIQNAIKYTPDGGAIRISGSILDQELPSEEQTIQIIVSDSGIGIAPENLERIFEKFFRVGDVLLHSTGETKFKGAGPGLGLTIARGIVEAHGGYIWVESKGLDEELFPGSQFHVVLPVQPRHAGIAKPGSPVADAA